MFFKGVKAEEYSDKFIEHYKWIYNDYVVKQKKGTRKYQQMSVTVRNSDKQFVYCVEPGTPIKRIMFMSETILIKHILLI